MVDHAQETIELLRSNVWIAPYVIIILILFSILIMIICEEAKGKKL